MLYRHSRLAAPWTLRSAAHFSNRAASGHLSRRALLAATALLGLIASTATVSGQATSVSPAPAASGWRPWVLSSTKEVQTPPSTNEAAELQQLHAFAKQRPIWQDDRSSAAFF